MPNRNAKLKELMHEGEAMYPPGMGNTPRALSTSQVSIAGLGNRAAPPVPAGTPTRSGRVVALVGRQTAWGTGRSRRAPTAAERARNKQRFVQWMKKNEPRLYAIAKQKAGNPPAGLGQDDSPGWFERFTNTVTQLAPSYLQYKAQKEVLDLQLQRAQQGLAPLDTSEIAPSVQVSLDPSQTRQALAQGAARVGDVLSSPWVLGAAAVGVFLILRK